MVRYALHAVRIRFERAVDATAGDIKYHQNSWVLNISRRTPDFPVSSKLLPSLEIPKVSSDNTDTNNDFFENVTDDVDKKIQAIVMVDIIQAGCLPSQGNQGNQGKVREIHFSQKWVREIREKSSKLGKVREKSGKSHHNYVRLFLL